MNRPCAAAKSSQSRTLEAKRQPNPIHKKPMSNEEVSNVAIAPNARRLLFAGFMAIFAAGVGFAIRGGIFGDWVRAFNFTGLEIGLINGAGFTGFCFGIIIGGVIVDRIGYGKLVVAAFALHALSALVTFT